MIQRIKNALWAFRNANLPMQDWQYILNLAELGEQSASGVMVSEATATRHATIFACINILARDMAGLPLKLYQRQTNGGRAEVTNHPVSHWLKEPNGYQTPMQWRMRAWYSVLSQGNQYEEVFQTDVGDLQTVPIDSHRVTVKLGRGYRREYEIKRDDGTTRSLPADRVFHTFGLSTDGGLTGVSPIRMCMDTVGRALALGEYSAAYFRSPVPKVIAKIVGNLKDGADVEKLRRQWTEKFAGRKGLSTIAIMPQGMEIDQIVKIPNNEAQFIETAKFVKEDLAQIYMVPMHRLQALDRATFSNIEHQALEYVQYTLLPWLTAFEQSVERLLLTREERETMFVRHNVDGLLRGDFKTRMEGSALAVQWGLATINERRALENQHSIEGGDDLLVPLNMVRLDDLGKETEPPDDGGDQPDPDDEDDDERQIALNRAAGIGVAELRSAASRRVLIHRIKPRLAKAIHAEVVQQAAAIRAEGLPILSPGQRRDALGFASWIEEYAKSRSDSVRSAVLPHFVALALAIAEAASAEVKAEFTEEQASEYASRWADNYATGFTGTTIAHLQSAAIEAQADIEADPAEVLDQRLTDWVEGADGEPRASREALRETFKLANTLAGVVYASAGFALVWATFGKTCRLCNGMRGKRVRGGEPFLQPGNYSPDGGAPIRVGKRGIKGPPLHSGCDCLIVPG